MNATITSGQTTSAAVDIQSGHLLGFALPAAFTGTAITFLVSVDGTTYQALYRASDGAAVSLTVAQGKSYSFTMDLATEISNWRWLKLVSGSAEGGTRTIALWVR